MFPLTNFYKDKNKKNGVSSQCKECKNKVTYTLRLNRAQQNIEKPTHKICSRCKINKEIFNYTTLKTNKDGLSIYCKECRKINIKIQKQLKEEIIILDNTINKICRKCNIEKNILEFRINRKSKDNTSYTCLDCLPKNNWSKEKQKASEQKYRLNNPEKIKEKYKKYAQNINRRVRDSLNHRIAGALLVNNSRKNNKTINYIGCDIPFFKKWIEYQFVNNMSWDNYGEWHLDHVKPCYCYNLVNDNDIKECFNWKNYQPLWKKDNLIKSNKIDNNLIETHKNKACNYEIYFLKISAQVKEGELLEHPYSP